MKSCHSAPDPGQHEKAFLEFLLSKSDEWADNVLFPTDDASLLVLSKYKRVLENSYKVVAEDWSIVRRLLEKIHTYEISSKYGVPCPRVELITGVAQAIDYARELGFPCLIKPSTSHTFFSRYGTKMVFVHSEGQLEEWLAKFEDYRGQLMLCEFIPGDDTCGANYNSFYIDNKARQEFTAAKVRLKPSSIGFPTVVVSKHIPEVIEYGRILSGSIGYSGFSCTEFKKDKRDNTYKLMEINARHNFSGMLALKCGINFPFLSYLQAIGGELPSTGQSQENGIYWIDEERDFKALFKSLWPRNASTAGAYLGPYLRRHVFAVSSLRDPQPSLQRASELVRRSCAVATKSKGADSRTSIDGSSGT